MTMPDQESPAAKTSTTPALTIPRGKAMINEFNRVLMSDPIAMSAQNAASAMLDDEIDVLRCMVVMLSDYRVATEKAAALAVDQLERKFASIGELLKARDLAKSKGVTQK